MRVISAYLIILLSALAFGCRAPKSAGLAWSTSPSGLGQVDLAPGAGPSPLLGQVCVVEAMGWIEERGAKGRVFLDTRKRGYPDTFPLGVNRVIKGWDEGIATMKKGGKRLLRVPPSLGYSALDRGNDIPEGATLLFELELSDIR